MRNAEFGMRNSETVLHSEFRIPNSAFRIKGILKSASQEFTLPRLHLAMLGVLVFIGLPVLLHLLMRQKPKHLLFPAFRFLQQRARTNRRKVRLRHLLLLLLRMALLALICL